MRSAAPHCPFLRHEFLAALEHTGCVGAGTRLGAAATITLRDEQGLAAAAPAYIKTHSYGEFVFDFAWAQAYARLGRRYYPKLTVAVPFTPGHRAAAAGARRARTRRAVAGRLLEALEALRLEPPALVRACALSR